MKTVIRLIALLVVVSGTATATAKSLTKESFPSDLPVHKKEIVSHVENDALQFQFDGDEVRCGGEVSDLTFVSAESDEDRPENLLLIISSKLSVTTDYCETVTQKTCHTVLRASVEPSVLYSLETLEWVCE